MLQDFRLVRHYQSLTDAAVDNWHRGYREHELRFLIDGYLLALRNDSSFEAHEIHRLEQEANRFLRDPANFELPEPEPEVTSRW
ncbi:MAG: DUF6761 family protein [Cyanobacteria bacterium J06642_2]